MNRQEIVERLHAAHEVAQWAKVNGFDTIEILWIYEAAILDVIHGIPHVAMSQRRRTDNRQRPSVAEQMPVEWDYASSAEG